jgi:hypothetical protein
MEIGFLQTPLDNAIEKTDQQLNGPTEIRRGLLMAYVIERTARQWNTPMGVSNGG